VQRSAQERARYAWTATALAALRTDRIGRRGEAVCEEGLEALGFRIVGRRVRTQYGELDLVAWRGNELWCFEVKTSRGPWRSCDARHAPGRRYSAVQRARVRRAAFACARALACASAPRTALVEVWIDAGGAMLDWRWTEAP